MKRKAGAKQGAKRGASRPPAKRFLVELCKQWHVDASGTKKDMLARLPPFDWINGKAAFAARPPAALDTDGITRIQTIEWDGAGGLICTASLRREPDFLAPDGTPYYRGLGLNLLVPGRYDVGLGNKWRRFPWFGRTDSRIGDLLRESTVFDSEMTLLTEWTGPCTVDHLLSVVWSSKTFQAEEFTLPLAAELPMPLPGCLRHLVYEYVREPQGSFAVERFI
jgi:hypothetical protein